MGQKGTHVLSLVRKVPVDSRHDFRSCLYPLAGQLTVLGNGKKCFNGPQVRLQVKLKPIDVFPHAEGLIAAAVRFIKMFGAVWDVKGIPMPLENGHLRWQARIYGRGGDSGASNGMPT